MHVELVDIFRCTQAHEDTWLVATAGTTRERTIVEGLLGCPVCGAEFPIRDGVALFGGSGAGLAGPPAEASDMGEGDAFRLAALLDLNEPGRTVALVGYPPAMIAALQSVVPVRVIAVAGGVYGHASNDPHGASAARDAAVTHAEPVAVIRCSSRLPLAIESLHGLATREQRLPSNAVSLLRAGGRLVAPAAVPLPRGVAELARDDREWVAAREVPPSGLVSLRRQSSAE